MKTTTPATRAKQYRIYHWAIVLLFPICVGQIGFSDPLIPDTDFFDHRMWQDDTMPEACHQQDFKPDTGLYSYSTFYGDLPVFGYPLRQCLRIGLNDTLNAEVTFYNGTGKDFDLSGQDYEHWFAPQVYLMTERYPAGLAFWDSTQLGYRVRGWAEGRDMIPDVKVLRPEDGGKIGIKLDIWNLPQGRFQLCLHPTNKVPVDFNAHLWGIVFECYPAISLADSCNAYEACFWRADEDSNFSAAKDWAGKILDINPTSVPGWWLKAFNSQRLGETEEAQSALDNAIDYLNAGSDPAMPDSTKRVLTAIEQTYVQWLHRWLPLNREQLGP